MKWDDKLLKLYMREIADTPLLTPQQEIELAAKIKKGDSKARDMMIRANLRLVVKIANDYSRLGLPLADLISEGNIGLMKAVERFDPAKGGKLSTYAAWWIKQGIKRSLANQTKTIRLPSHLVDKIARMRREMHRMEEALGREPTDRELSASLELPEKTITHWKTVSMKPTSLDAPIGEDGGSFADIIGDSQALTPYEHMNEQQLQAQLEMLLHTLDRREQDILTRRYGLRGKQTETLEDVGRVHRITRERVRQIQNGAILKLRERMDDPVSAVA